MCVPGFGSSSVSSLNWVLIESAYWLEFVATTRLQLRLSASGTKVELGSATFELGRKRKRPKLSVGERSFRDREDVGGKGLKLILILSLDFNFALLLPLHPVEKKVQKLCNCVSISLSVSDWS